MIPKHIERELTIDAAPETVWAVITEPDHVAGWFSDLAEIDLRPGGAGLLTWHEHGSARLRVERADQPHVFAFRWSRGAEAEPDAGNSTLVEFTLTAEGGGTRLRVVESGFDELERSDEEREQYAAENTRGWRLELDDLQAYVSALVLR